ncbi:hypothetical protein [Janthinobacterium sp. HLX7-2]|uniref:hypothetical protein n=1 Tax=Janthinobacterium sp. HLX7-2 TaxID=1259331 RepID=UPI003F224796
MIYFNKALQERALGLGSKESVQFTRFATGFEALPGPEKLYRKRAPSRAATHYAAWQDLARNET